LGTPAYVAPEQIEGDDVDGKADVYSLGCLLYECLTGEAPFARDSELAVLWAHLNDPPPAPPGLEQVMAKALAKDPQERYATCGELMEGAREALGLTRGRDRRPLALAALGVLVAAGALVTGLVLVFGNGGQGPAKPDLTVRNNSLVRLDPETNKIASVTKVGRGPRAMAVAGQTVWVYNTDDGTVSAIDARTGTVKRTARISASAPSGGNGPLIAADASGAWIVGTSGGKGVLTKVRLGLTYQPEFWLDYDPVAIALGEGAVWVAANGVRGNAVLRISPSTGAVLAKVPFRAGIDANLAGIAVGEGAVWVTNVAGTLFRIDPATPLITGKVNVGLYPAAPAVGYGAAWVTTYEPRPRLVRVDPRTMRVTQTIPAPGIDSYDLAFVDGSVWWNGWRAGTVWRFDPRTGKIASTIRLTPPRPEGVAALFHPWTIATGASSVWVTMSTEVSVG
jgi:DNA-binding beta-propeller fold protein YncE